MPRTLVSQQNLLKTPQPVASSSIEATSQEFIANRLCELKSLLNSNASVGFIKARIFQWQQKAETDYKTAEGTLFAKIKTALKSIIKDKDSDLKTIKRVFELAQENDFLSFEERDKHLMPALTERLSAEIKKELAGDRTSIAGGLEKEFGLESTGKCIRSELTRPLPISSPQKVAAAVVIHNLQQGKEEESQRSTTLPPPKEITKPKVSKDEPPLIPKEEDLSSDEGLIKFLINSSSANSSSEALYDLLSNAGKEFQSLADEFLEHMTAPNLDEPAFDETSRKILDQLGKFNKVQLPEIQKIARQLKNAKLEITLRQIFSTLIPKDESAKDYRLAISNLLKADLSLTVYEKNLGLLKTLAEVKRLGGKVEISLLKDLANTESRQNTIEIIEKRLEYFKNVEQIKSKGIDIPEKLLLNPDDKTNQEIIKKTTDYRKDQKHTAEAYLKFEGCENLKFKALAVKFDLLLNRSTDPDYLLRENLINFLERRNHGYNANTDRNGQAEKFIENLIKLMEQKDHDSPQNIIGVFGAREMLNEVLNAHHKFKGIPNDASYSEFVGHYWNIEKAVELMKDGKTIIGVSFRKYEDLNREIEKATGIKPDIDKKGPLRGEIGIRDSLRTACERELDIVYIDDDRLIFVETKTSNIADAQSNSKNHQTDALEEIRRQYEKALPQLDVNLQKSIKHLKGRA